ncbi:MAG: FAD-binding oxidoreductase [Bacteriovoracaceae bacterium]|nr:FAD-binding oxidoreductase [Bacteriovoracaceae bacterium]
MKKLSSSWGNNCKQMSDWISLDWQDEIVDFNIYPSYLVQGQGRSYGDESLNSRGAILSTRNLNKSLGFNFEARTFCAEAGITLSEILKMIVPKGFFLPVTPGTKWVSLGGAIANDVHGKNHHSKGTFGNFVVRLELLRSDGKKYLCSADQNSEYFYATIGGMGLTGIILWAEFRLQPIESSDIELEEIKFSSYEEFLSLNEQSNKNFEYTVAWFDGHYFLKSQGELQGIYMRGNHGSSLKLNQNSPLQSHQDPKWSIPCFLPNWFLNKKLLNAMNFCFFHKRLAKIVKKRVHYDPYFYPLDGINHWNRAYGEKGFYQLQSVFPINSGRKTLQEISRTIKKFDQTSFINVLKTFGEIPSHGHLKFSRPGITLCMDFKNEGISTLKMLQDLNEITFNAGGCLNPSKDSTMNKEQFKKLFQKKESEVNFFKMIDPKFSSDLFQRVRA